MYLLCIVQIYGGIEIKQYMFINSMDQKQLGDFFYLCIIKSFFFYAYLMIKNEFYYLGQSINTNCYYFLQLRNQYHWNHFFNIYWNGARDHQFNRSYHDSEISALPLGLYTPPYYWKLLHSGCVVYILSQQA